MGLIQPLELDIWLTFNAQGQVAQYDATFRWFQWATDVALQHIVENSGVSL